MAPKPNPLIRQLTLKHGTGIASRADASGNHAMAAGLMDTYATNGQTVPANLQPAITRLNEITQRESILSKTSASARGALAGTGYDPVAVRKEAGELEQFLLSESADARNVGARISQETAAAGLREKELQNQLTASTMDAKSRAQIAAFDASTTISNAQVSEEEAQVAVRASMDFVQETGVGVDELYDIFASNDPALMKEAFGTSDRAAAHGVMQLMELHTQQGQAARGKSMTSAASYQAMQLAEKYSTDDLLAMAGGSMEMPEGVTQLALQDAIGTAEQQTNAQANLIVALGDKTIKAETLRDLALQGMSDAQMNATFAQALTQGIAQDGKAPPGTGPSGDDFAQALADGNIAEVAEALLSATEGGTLPLEVETSDGTIVEVSAQEMIEHMVARTESREQRMETSIVNNSQMRQHMIELEENKRMVDTIGGIMGIAVPQELSLQTDALFGQARTLFAASVKAVSAEERLGMVQEAKQLMQAGRQAIMDYGKAKGVPEDFMLDIQQGRFSSDRTYKQGLVDLMGSGGSASRSVMARAIRPILLEAGVTAETMQAWAASDSINVRDLGIEPGVITAAIDSVGYQALAAGALTTIADSPVFEQLPPAAREVLDDALMNDGASASPGDRFKRVIAAVQMTDRLMMRLDGEAVMAGGESTYMPGQLLNALSEGLDNRDFMVNALAPNGQIDRATAALLTMYIGDREPTSTSGDAAIAFDDLPAYAAQKLSEDLRHEMVGASLTPIAATARSAITSNVSTFMKGTATGLTNSPEYQKRRGELLTAVETVYMQKIMDPDQGRSKIFGFNLPSLGASAFGQTGLPSASLMYSVATPEDVIDVLTMNGHTDSANYMREFIGAE